MDDNNQDGKRPETIKVHLLANGKQVGAVKEVSVKDDWKYTFKDMPKYENGEEIKYTISEDAVSGYTSKVDGNNLINKHESELTAISGEKRWVDDNNQDGKRPETIKVHLLANGKQVGAVKEVSVKDDWKYTFKDMPKYENGEEIKYTISEDAVSGYTSKVDGNNLINKHESELTDISGEKQWLDDNNRDGKRPEMIKVHLLANGKQVGIEKTVSVKEAWKYTFKDIPKYENGKVIKYTISEDEVSGYTSIINGNNLINKHESELTDISGEKLWVDNNNQDGKRPETIKVHLLANGKQVGAVKEISSKDDWKYTFKDMPKYENGEEIKYTISEDAVSGYTSKVDGNNLINKHESELTDVSGMKMWVDDNNQDGKRPESIKIHLLANGKQVGIEKTVSVKEAWKYTFKDMPKYENGEVIKYTISEDEVSGYTSIIDGNNLINKHESKLTNISGEKLWVDDNNRDGKRPEMIKVHLLANGKQVGVVKEVSSKDTWKYTFKDIPKYENGEEIKYTISEDLVTGYTSKVVGNNLINTHTPRKTSVQVMKKWEDQNNQDGIRPDKVRVQLYADAKIQGDVVELNEANHWIYQWTGLDEKSKGVKVKYNVKEVAVSKQYKSSVSVVNEERNEFLIINSRESEITDISGMKTWIDDNNRDGKRPETIKVHLLANGKQMGIEKTVSSKEAWKYTFKDMPKYENGKLIKYTISEDAVPGYTSKIDGNNLINKHESELTAILGEKLWVDDNNRDGKRPEIIKVHLLANGKQVGIEKKVSAKEAWKYTFKDMPKYENGEVIKYAISEDAVSGYTSKIDGNNLINKHESELINISGEKLWVDDHNRDGKRPETIKVHLFANGKQVSAEKTISSKDNWKYSFKDIPKYENGKLIKYTISEDAVSGYTSKIDGNNLINEHESELTDISGEKLWVDDNNRDGKRPEMIKVHLLANDKQVGAAKEISAKDSWKYTFKDMPKYENGRTIDYTISEDAVDGYMSELEGSNLINRHEADKTTVHVIKKWNDCNNKGGLRPDKVKVQLYADDKVYGEAIELNANNRWESSWRALYLRNVGKKIRYTIREVDTNKSYVAVIKEITPNYFEITNTFNGRLTPDKPDKKLVNKLPVKKEPTKEAPDEKQLGQKTVVKQEITKQESMKPKVIKVNTVPKKTTQKQLPKTGEKENVWVSIFGILIVLLSGERYFYGNRHRSNLGDKLNMVRKIKH